MCQTTATLEKAANALRQNSYYAASIFLKAAGEITEVRAKGKASTRALLDVLQEKCTFIKQVIHLPTSVGGVPERSVPHGLAEIRKAFESGKQWFARSDISGFFYNIPRKDVLAIIAEHVDDARFLSVLEQATQVVLCNETSLGEDRDCFPTDEIGVAQGSPLSPLFGNILLSEFDTQFNGRGIVCVRFIDDFVLLGETQGKVAKAFASAQAHLGKLGLRCHDPFIAGADTRKAECGEVSRGFDFLGYRIEPGLYQPSSKARQKFSPLSTITFGWAAAAS